MARQRRCSFRGIAQPVYVREPGFVRCCAAFVDNLSLILKTAFIMGVVLLVQDLRLFLDEVNQPAAEAAALPAASGGNEAVGAEEAHEPVLSEGVKQAFNCTFKEYRDAHYDDCVQEPSLVYPRPQGDPDDTGLMIYDEPALFAFLAIE